MLQIILLVLTAMLIYSLRIKDRILYRKIPGNYGWPLIGHLYEYNTNVVGLTFDMNKKYGSVSKIMMGGVPTILISDADAFRKVTSLGFKFMSPIDGSFDQDYNVFSANGKKWEDLRKLHQPALNLDSVGMHFKFLKVYMNQMFEKLPDRKNVDLLDIFMFPFWGTIMKGFCSVDLSLKNEKDVTIIKRLIKAAQFEDLTFLPNIAFTVPELAGTLPFFSQVFKWTYYQRPKYPLKEGKKETLTEVINETVREKAEDSNLREESVQSSRKDAGAKTEPTKDVFFDFKNWRDQKGEGFFLKLYQRCIVAGKHMTDPQIETNEKLTMFSATDTPTQIVSFAIHFLSNNPDKLSKLLKEIDDFGADQELEYADLDKFPYSKAVINETMRIHTSDFACYRKNDYPIVLKDVKVPANTKLLMPMVGLHLNEEYWTDPLEFHPERFLGDKTLNKKTPSAYYPMGFGPRVCQGQRLSFMIMQTALIMVYRKYTFDLQEKGTRLEFYNNTSLLKPKGPIMAKMLDRGNFIK